ncbi:MAG: sialidase family protein [Candidatus Hodarchaeota archaeon]
MNKATFLKHTKHFFQGLLLGILLFGILAGSLFLWWAVRPSTYQVNPRLDFQNEVYVSNGRHNANTDLIYWNGYYYFIYANQPGNQGSTTTFLSLNRGDDFHNMTEIMQLRVPDEDIRDPKFAVINNQLFIYYLNNKGIMAIPYGTQYVNSSDGLTFSTPAIVPGQQDWCFWKPKTLDNVTWYCTAYSNDQNEIILLNSTDGITWAKVSTILGDGIGISEPELTFLSDGRMLVTIRNERHPTTVFGSTDAGTGLAIAAPPYTTWNYTLDTLTKLDGPALFNLNDTSNTTRYFAVGRFQPERDSVFTALGSVFARKRTSLFEFVNLNSTPELKYISDLPSSGDTAYEGVIIEGDRLYITYYSSDPSKDPAWMLGLFIPSDIYLVNISITSLFDAADNPLDPSNVLPWDNYIIFFGNIGFELCIVIWLFRKHSGNRRKKKVVPTND